MQQIFILGRSGNQPFPIEADREYVHNQHARLTADTDSREWFIEDLKGTTGNGVFVRDKNGCFLRVLSCRIKPTYVVRLGPENAKSFTFMAHHVLTPDNYNYEFAYMQALEKKLGEQEAAQTAVQKRHNLNTIVAPIVTAALSMSLRLFLEIDMGILIALTMGLSSIPVGILRVIYRNDADKLRLIKGRRAKLIQCPKCWRPLSDYDLRNGKCSACKAM